MDDKELADKVVALGVGRCVLGKYYVRSPDGDAAQPHEQRTVAGFVRDWRVAGALMEKVFQTEGLWLSIYDQDMPIEINPSDDRDMRLWLGRQPDESLPRAIIEACVEALASEADNE